MILLTIIAVAGLLFGLSLMDCNWDGAGMILALIFGVLLLGVVIGWPCCYYETKADILDFEAARQTLINARANGNEYEAATIQKEVMALNRGLARQKYWNTTIFDRAIPDSIMELEPIK